MPLDLDRLRPETNSRADICAALVRCTGAAQIIAAELERVRAERAELLMKGSVTELIANATALTTAMGEGIVVRDLAEQLQQQLKNYAEPVAAPSLEQQALHAAGLLSTWWTRHGDETVRGTTLLIEAAAAIIAWRAAAAPVPPPSNVAPFTPRPVA